MKRIASCYRRSHLWQLENWIQKFTAGIKSLTPQFWYLFPPHIKRSYQNAVQYAVNGK